MRWLPAKHADSQVREVINFFLLEVALNTYVDGDKHRFFDSETDLNYPPNWHRFMEFLEVTIRGTIRYLESVAAVWASALSLQKISES